MSVQWQKVHVFISSTFNDMHAERDYLVKRVFPELQDWCERRKLRLVDVDLRWGVTEADATANANVVRTCLKRIDDCRPFFVCLLGQRYGWAPTADDVSLETLKEYPRLKAALDEGVSVTEMEIRHAIVEPFRETPEDRADDSHYQLAEHSFFYLREPDYLGLVPADPPALRRIYTDEAEKDGAKRADLRSKLHTLREATIPEIGRPVRRYRSTWKADARTPEIALPLACQALLPANVRRWQDDWAKALGDDVAFASGGAGTVAGSETKTYRDLVALAEEARRQAEEAVFKAAEDIRDQDALKEEARKQGEAAAAEATKNYRELGTGFIERARAYNERLTQGRLADFAVIDGRCNSQALAGESLALAILCDLKAAITARHPDHVEVEHATGLQRELDQQEQFLFLSSDGFIECGNDLAELDDYVLGDSQRLLVLTAEGGMGKSMLLANWIDGCRRAPDRFPNTTFHARFVGQSDGSSSVAGLLRLLLEEMRDVAGKLPRTTIEKQTDPDGREREVEVPFDIPADPRKVPQFWREQLPRLGERGRTVIVIDALNQLESGLRDVNWLPLQGLPPGVKVIVSFRSGAEGAAALIERLERNPHVQFDDVAPFKNVADRERLVDGYLKQYLKELDEQHVKQLVQAAGAANPLYLKVVLSELRVFGSFTGLREKIELDFGPTPVTAFGALLRRLEGDPSYTAVEPKKAVPVLFGLLLHARRGLSAGELTDLFVDQLKLQELRREDVAAAVQVLLRQAVAFLGRRDGLFGYFFESFEQAAGARYVVGGEDVAGGEREATGWHGVLAEYFGGQPLYVAKDEGEAPNRRKLDELAYQQASARAWAGLQGTLTSFDFLHAKLKWLGYELLVEDYLIAMASGYRDRDLALVQSALALGANVLRADDRQLPVQLVGRLMHADEPRIAALVAEANVRPNWPWLRPLHTSLAQAGGQLLHTLEVRSGEVLSATVSPDGRRAVSGSRSRSGDRILCVWDMDSGALIHTLEGPSEAVYSVAVSPDSRRAVSGSYDSTVRVWDMDSGALLHSLEGHSGAVYFIAVRPDGCQAVSGSFDSTVRVWDLNSGALLHTLAGHSERVSAVAVSPDGRLAVSGSYDKTMRVWDLDSGALLHTLVGHSEWVSAVTVSPDGRRAVSGSRDKTVRVWDLDAGGILCTLGIFDGAVKTVVVSPDGRRAIVAGHSRNLCIWDLDSGALVHTLEGHRHEVTSVGVSPDGRRAVSGSRDSTLRVWDLDSGALVHVLEGHSDAVWSVAISPDGSRVVSGSDDTTMRVWDLNSGVVPHPLMGHSPSRVYCVAVSPDGRSAVSGSRDNTLRVWDLNSGGLLHSLAGQSGPVGCVAVSSDGRRAVSGSSSDIFVRLWDLGSGALLHSLQGHSKGANSVAICPNGRHAVSGSSDKTVRVWDVDSGALRHSLKGHSDAVTSVAVSPDGRRAVSASWDKTVRIWDLDSGALLHTLEGHSRGVKSVAVSPNGRCAVSASEDKTLRVWDLDSGALLHTLEGHSERVSAVAVSPDGRRSVSGSWDKTVRVWDLDSGTLLHTLEGHCERVSAVAVSPDGRRAVSGSYDKTMRVWNLDSGRPLYTLEGHAGDVLSVAVSPDGRRAISGSGDYTLRVWDLASGAPVHTLGGHMAWVTSVAMSLDGHRAVSGSIDRTLRVWDLDLGALRHTLRGHFGEVLSVAVSPDGRRAVLGSHEGDLRAWDLDSGRPLYPLEGHAGDVRSVALSPDGRRVLSGSDDTTVRVWELDSGALLHTLEGHAGAVKSVAASPDGCCAVSGSDDKTVRVWDLHSGALLRTLVGHSLPVWCVAVSPDGRRVLSASADRTVRVWGLDSGIELARFAADSPLRCLDAVLSLVVTGGEDGNIHVLSEVRFELGSPVMTTRRPFQPSEPSPVAADGGIELRCPSCGTTFALSADRLGQEIACADCGIQLRLNPFVVHEFTTTPAGLSSRVANLARRLLGRR